MSAAGITILVSTHYMDEAERCHRLAYIAYGSILAEGTPEAVIAQQQLRTWAVSGKDIQQFPDRLRNIPGVDQVATFGSALHVCSESESVVEPELQRFASQHNLTLERVQPSLEDVFIRLMRQTKDPFKGEP